MRDFEVAQVKKVTGPVEDQIPRYDKDPKALRLAEIWEDPAFWNAGSLADQARFAELSPADLVHYFNDANFMKWVLQRYRASMVKYLPRIMDTVRQQAEDGGGRQQKMFLDFIGIDRSEEEHQQPNLIIVNNIPRPSFDAIDTDGGDAQDD